MPTYLTFKTLFTQTVTIIRKNWVQIVFFIILYSLFVTFKINIVTWAGESYNMDFYSNKVMPYTWLGTILNILFLYVVGAIQIGFIKIMFDWLDHKKTKFTDIFKYIFSFVTIVKYYIIQWLLALLAMSGFLAIIIWYKRGIFTDFVSLLMLIGSFIVIAIGIWIFLRLQFAVYYVISKNGIIESLRKSWLLTRGNILKLRNAYLLVLLLVSILFIIGFGLIALILSALESSGILARYSLSFTLKIELLYIFLLPHIIAFKALIDNRKG